MLIPPVADRQEGVFTRRQARDAGATSWLIARRLAEGVWHEVLHDTFVLNGVAMTDRVRIRAASLATRSVISHASADRAHALGLTTGASLHVVTTPRVHIEVAGVVDHRLRLGEDEVDLLDGIRVTNRTRTLFDLLASEQRGTAERILFRAVQQNWLSASTLRAGIERRRRMVGNTQLRELAALLGTGAHSVAERRLHELLRTIDGLDWQANAHIRIDGPAIVVDVLIPRRKVVIEIDGRAYHSDSETFRRDRSRQNRLVTAGYTVVRFTWLDLTQNPGYVCRTIAAAAR